MDTLGVNMKQTSCYFRALAPANTIRENICYTGPRAGVNWNDGFMGGDVLEGNVIFDMVRETGDHGTFNSWSRREWFYDCSLAPSLMPKSMAGQPRDPNGLCLMPALIRTQHNFFIGPAGWNMDHDDGSSNFQDFSNIVYQGGYKYRDGQNRNMSSNLMVMATPKFQVSGFPTDLYVNNIQVGTGTICGPPTIGEISGTKYLFLPKSKSSAAPCCRLPAHRRPHRCLCPPPAQQQPTGGHCDKGTTGNVSAAGLYELAMKTVAHGSVPLQALLKSDDLEPPPDPPLPIPRACMPPHDKVRTCLARCHVPDHDAVL